MYRPYRRATQMAAFAIMFVVPVLNLFEIYAVTGTFYAINIGRLGIADPVVILQAIFASGELTPPLAAAVIFPIFLALILGRVWCGWLCPYHLISDWCAWLRGKFKAKILGAPEPDSFAVPNAFGANMTRFGFLIAGMAGAGVIAIPVLNYVSAPGILSTEAMIFVKSRVVSLEVGFIAILVLMELLVLPRFWCRLFCPTGAFISLFRIPYTLRVVNKLRNLKKPCCKENYCSAECPMGLEPAVESEDLLCTNCGRCIDACKEGSGDTRLRFAGFSSARGSRSAKVP